MSKTETAKLLASAATDARVRAIQEMTDSALEKTRAIEAVPDQIAVKLIPLVESLASLSEEAKSTLKIVVEKTRAIEAVPDQIAAKMIPLAASLASLSEEAKSALNAVQETALNLPEAYAAKIKTVTVEAEIAITHLMPTLLEIHEKSREIATYAKETNDHIRRSMWQIALIAAGLSTVVPTALMFGISRAARIPAWQLMQSTLGL